jgi:hypothetical protein
VTLLPCLRAGEREPVPRPDLNKVKGLVMTVEKVRHSGAYVLSDLVGEGAGEYLFTRTYYGYTLAQAKAQFKIALKEAK